MYVLAPRRMASRSRRLGDDLPGANLTPSQVIAIRAGLPSGALAPGCSFWDVFTGNYSTCSQKPVLFAQEQAQIQSVADNAVKFYGADSPTAIAAQQMADSQKAQAYNDVYTIAASVENSNIDQSPITGIANSIFNPN